MRAFLAYSRLNTGASPRLHEVRPIKFVRMRNGFPTLSWRCSAVSCCVFARNSRLATFPFPQFFLLAFLDQKEVLTMSAIAQKMGHTTAAASGLVARLENLGYVVRSGCAR